MRRLVFVIVAVAAVVAGWSGFWFYVARDIERRIALWVEQQRADGLSAEYGGIVVSGFPFAWKVAIDRPAMAAAGPTQWEWSGERTELALRPWALGDVAMRFPGAHHVAAGAGESRREAVISARQPDGRIVLDAQGKLAQLTLDLVEVEVREGDLSPTRIARAQVRLVPRRPAEATHRSDSLDSAIRLDRVTLPAPPRSGLGETIERLDIDTSFKGRLPPGPLADAVAHWRDDGGTIEVNRLAVLWGPLDLDGNGTLALDAENRPLGAFTVRVRGYGETIDTFARTGLIRPREAAGAKVALNMFARPNSGGTSELTVPLTAQDGRLAIAGFNLMRIDPLRFE